MLKVIFNVQCLSSQNLRNSYEEKFNQKLALFVIDTFKQQTHLT